MVDMEEVKKQAEKEIDEEKMKKYVSKYKELKALVESSEKQLEQAKQKLKEFKKEPGKFVQDTKDYYAFSTVSSYLASHTHSVTNNW